MLDYAPAVQAEQPPQGAPRGYRTETCPECRRLIDVDRGYSAWCGACGWNVQPIQARDRRTVLGRLRLALGRRLGRGLFEEMRGRRPRAPRPAIATLLGFALAACVYLVTVAIAALGVSIIASSPNIFTLAFGGFFLGLAWLARPRLGHLEVEPLGRDALPRLWSLVERVATAVGGARIDGVVLTPEYNAAYGTYGLRRRRILFIGLPLWLTLEPQERVALLGHELGHGVNRDATRGGFISGALNALVELHTTLEPDELLPSEDGIFGFLKLPFQLVLLLWSRVFLGLAYLLLLLFFRSSQRAEYYADAIAMRLAGSAATVRLLERLHAAPGVEAMTWVGETADPIGSIVRKVREMPAREVERLRRAERMSGTRLDASHPPTLYRLEVIEAQPDAPPKVVLSHGEADAIDGELERFREPMGRKLVDEYLSAVSA